jgi:hypothetical protein
MVVALIAGVVLIVVVLWDAFETVILPRTVRRKLRITRLFYRSTWQPWTKLASLTRGKRRETLLSVYGPLSLPLLLTVWAFGLILGFAVIQWAMQEPLSGERSITDFRNYLYMSGTTFFTLGYGDVVPTHFLGEALAVLESGTGFGFLALVLGYLPVLYAAFSRREVNISLLDARAGSPPTAAELMRRHQQDHGLDALQQLLSDWERWSAELMETHLSYPVLAYFRSQHDNQSWLAALTVVLDTSALVLVSCGSSYRRQAQLTFAMARHAVVDLSQIFGARPQHPAQGRLKQADWEQMRQMLGPVASCDSSGFEELTRLRSLYEPYLETLAQYLRLRLPPWLPERSKADNWQTSGWDRSASLTPRPTPDDDPDAERDAENEHF